MAKINVTEGAEVRSGNKPDFWQRDGALVSLWQKHAGSPFVTEERLTGQVYDVVVVGAGITGLTTALRLQEAGKECIVVDAHHIGFGTTGGTTAHINTLLDTPYHTIERDFGTDNATLVADAARAARDLIARNVSAYEISCDFEYKDGVLFAQTEKEEAELQKIYDASRRAGVDVSPAETIPVPLEHRAAISYRMQAQIHPLIYIQALAREFIEAGGVILQNNPALGSERRDGIHHVEMDKGTIHGRHLIYATHIPPGVNILHFRCAPYRSYVLAAQLADNRYPNDLAYDMQEPYHYFRTHQLGANVTLFSEVPITKRVTAIRPGLSGNWRFIYINTLM